MAKEAGVAANDATKGADTFSFHTVIVLHALVFGFFVVYLVAGHHWSDGVISENRLAEVKDRMADLSEHPAVIFFVGVVPLVIVTYMQAKGSIGLGMKVKNQ